MKDLIIKLGTTFSHRYHGMTRTSAHSYIRKSYEVIHLNDDGTYECKMTYNDGNQLPADNNSDFRTNWAASRIQQMDDIV